MVLYDDVILIYLRKYLALIYILRLILISVFFILLLGFFISPIIHIYAVANCEE